MRKIEYDKILENLNEMINALEFDSMRSGGKMKVNAETLVHLYTLKERYTKVKPHTPKKTEG